MSHARPAQRYLVWLLLATSQVAWARSNAGEDAVLAAQAERVRAHYERGIARYKQGRFEDAIEAFKAAYAISASPGLLFNIAQCYRQLEDLPGALTAYRGYIQQQPDAPNRAEVELRIVDLEREMRVREAANAPPPPEPHRVQAVTTAPIAAAPTPRPDTSTHHRRLLIGSLVAIGGIATISFAVGGGLALRAANDADALRAAPNGSAWNETRAQRYDDGRRATAASSAMLAVGGVTLATGVLLAVIFRHSLHAERAPRALAMVDGWRF